MSLVNHPIFSVTHLLSDKLQSIHHTRFARQLRPRHVIIEDFFRDQEQNLLLRRLEIAFAKENGQHNENVAAIHRHYRQTRNAPASAEIPKCKHFTIYPEYIGEQAIPPPECDTARQEEAGKNHVQADAIPRAAECTAGISYSTERTAWWRRLFPRSDPA